MWADRLYKSARARALCERHTNGLEPHVLADVGVLVIVIVVVIVVVFVMVVVVVVVVDIVVTVPGSVTVVGAVGCCWLRARPHDSTLPLRSSMVCVLGTTASLTIATASAPMTTTAQRSIFISLRLRGHVVATRLSATLQAESLYKFAHSAKPGHRCTGLACQTSLASLPRSLTFART